MSLKGKKDFDLLILYDEAEAKLWMDYIESCLTEEKKDLKIQMADLKSNLSNISSLFSKSSVVCLVMSPACLEVVAKNADILKPCLAKCAVAVIKLYINNKQFESDIAQKYDVKVWNIFTFGEEETGNKKVATDIVKLVNEPPSSLIATSYLAELAQKLQKTPPETLIKPKETNVEENPEKDQGADKLKGKGSKEESVLAERTSESDDNTKTNQKNRVKVVKPKTNLPTSEKMILKDVCPDCIRKADERVLLVLRWEIPDSQLIQVEIDGQKYDTKRLNPYCYLFQAPAHKAGKVSMYLYRNGKKECKWPLHYSSPSALAYTCPQYLQELLGLPDLQALDKQLSSLFKDSVPMDDTAALIFSPKNLITTIGQKKSSDVLPTLLHFACYYGLQQLCISIIDFPGANFALEVENVNNKTPIDLAKEQDFSDIVQYLETFTEMQNYMEHFGGLYEHMTGGKTLAADGYMYMKGQQTDLLDDYDVGRIPRNSVEPDYVDTIHPEDHYEIKLHTPGQVEEVDPDEDYIELISDDPAPRVPPKPRQDDPMFSTAESMSPLDPGAPRRPPRRGMESPVFADDMPQYQAPTRPPKPEEDPIFGRVVEKPKTSLGSANQDELRDLMESYKCGDLNIEDIETLFKAWQQRNKGCSASMKERQKQMQEVKRQHMHLINLAENKKKSFFHRITKKNTPTTQALQIQHNVTPNTYTSFTSMQTSRGMGNRDSTTSTSSFSSTSSSSSSGSRGSRFDSACLTVEEDEEDLAPVRPPKPSSTTLPRAGSRLPIPPRPLYTSHSTLPPRTAPRKN